MVSFSSRKSIKISTFCLEEKRKISESSCFGSPKRKRKGKIIFFRPPRKRKGNGKCKISLERSLLSICISVELLGDYHSSRIWCLFITVPFPSKRSICKMAHMKFGFKQTFEHQCFCFPIFLLFDLKFASEIVGFAFHINLSILIKCRSWHFRK